VLRWVLYFVKSRSNWSCPFTTDISFHASISAGYHVLCSQQKLLHMSHPPITHNYTY
jgi:hypothetical protein